MKQGFIFIFFAGLVFFYVPKLRLGVPALAEKSERFIDRIIDVESTEKNATYAKKELIEKAVIKGSESIIKEIIGESKYSRNLFLIKNKLIKLSGRYVPVTKPGELQALEGGGFRLSVLIKLNRDDLQTLLLENGLLYESDSTPVLLPVIEISDRQKGRKWAWWSADGESSPKDLQRWERIIESALKQSFWKNNFYVIRPQSLRYQKFLTPGSSLDWLEWAGLWNAQILIRGEVFLSKAESLNFHLVALQTQNGRTVAEVTRVYNVEMPSTEFSIEQKLNEVVNPVVQDLASQVLEAWQKGSIGSNLFRLVILGRVPLGVQEKIKEAIKDQTYEIKNVKERFISTDEFVLEIDSSISPRDLQLKMPGLSVDGYLIKYRSANDKEAIYVLYKY